MISERIGSCRKKKKKKKGMLRRKYHPRPAGRRLFFCFFFCTVQKRCIGLMQVMGTGRRANQQREMGRAREMPRRLMPCSSASRQRCSMTGNLAAIRAEEGGGSSVWFQDGGVTDDEAETERKERHRASHRFLELHPPARPDNFFSSNGTHADAERDGLGHDSTWRGCLADSSSSSV